MKFTRVQSLGLTLGLCLSLLVPGLASAQTSGRSLPVLIAAPVTQNGSTVGQFTGTFNITSFRLNSTTNTLFAVGTVSGILRTASGVRQIITSAAVPVNTAATTATCQILHLVLGPLHLNLLGLHVDLSRITLNITAQSGPGNLLGNLLCDIANLLNASPLNLSGLLTDLQAILTRLGI